MITVHFTEQEAQQLVQILMQTPLPAVVSQPIATKIGNALAVAQQQHMLKQAADMGIGMAVEGGAGAGAVGHPITLSEQRRNARPLREVLPDDENIAAEPRAPEPREHSDD